MSKKIWRRMYGAAGLIAWVLFGLTQLCIPLIERHESKSSVTVMLYQVVCGGEPGLVLILWLK